MCGETLPEEKQCLNQTIAMIVKSIEKGEKKLLKLFKEAKDDKPKNDIR